MATLPPPATNNYPGESIEKQVYNIAEKYSDYVPLKNDRNRLGYTLYKYFLGEADPPEISVKSIKIKIENISLKELVNKINEDIKQVKT
jgi:hypothetical protein